MRIKTSNQTHTLYRYGGSKKGQTLETKIGSVQVGTPPNAIPSELAENLTPRELRELEKILTAERAIALNGCVIDLAASIDVAVATLQDVTDIGAIQKFSEALARATTATRRVLREREIKSASNDAPGTAAAA